MSDEEIIELAGSIFNKGINTKAIAFARAIESRTLIKIKAEWYLLGAEDERRACAKICQEFLSMDCADAIKARGE